MLWKNAQNISFWFVFLLRMVNRASTVSFLPYLLNFIKPKIKKDTRIVTVARFFSKDMTQKPYLGGHFEITDQAGSVCHNQSKLCLSRHQA